MVKMFPFLTAKALQRAKPYPPKAFFPSTFLLPALYSFHQSGLPTSFTKEGLTAYLTASDPLHPALLVAGIISIIVFVLGEITGNVSQVDRMWTFLPLIYSTYWTFLPKLRGGVVDARMALMYACQLAWSARLTTNTYRRGFFNPKTEDYRWLVVRDEIPAWAFRIFNFAFIAFIQNYLLLAANLPFYAVLTQVLSTREPVPLTFRDWAIAGVFVATLAVEMLADQQMQNFQWFKTQAIRTGKANVKGPVDEGKLRRGFITDGLWGWSRHPNFACEQFTWWVLYAFSVLPFVKPSELPAAKSLLQPHLYFPTSYTELKGTVIKDLMAAQGVWWNYSIVGAAAMTALFTGSTWITERISVSKYPLYTEYQRRVGKFRPGSTVLKGLWVRLVHGAQAKADLDNLIYGSGPAPATAEKKSQ